MSTPRDVADALTWSLARQCRPGDVLVVGVATPLKIARGKNALWSKGGLQYAPPIR